MIYDILKRFIGRPVKRFYIFIEDKTKYKNYSRIIKDKEFCKNCLLKQKSFKENCNNIVTVAMRGSHCDYGFNPECMEETAFNFGLTSMDLFGSYHLYQYINNLCPKLKNVIVFYGFFLNGFELSKTREKWRCVYYHDIFNIPYPLNNFLSSDIKKMQKFYKKIPKIQVDAEPFYGYYTPNATVYSDAEKRVKGHLKNYNRSDNGLVYLEKIYQQTKVNRQNLCVIIPPFREDYLKNLPEDIEKGAISKLVKIIPENQIYNFLHDGDFNIEDFADTDHLNPYGAKKLSIKINKILQKLVGDNND